MRSFWSDPYLWIHLAGLAAAPLWLEFCFLGLAVGDPVLPFWLELLFVAAVGIAPILWMQWQRPFYIFSLVAVAIKPEQLTEDQRRLLTLFKMPRNRIASVVVAVGLAALLRSLYQAAPIAAAITPLSHQSHLVGIGLAAIAFLAANLFCQVPISVLSVMLTSEAAFTATEPTAIEHIRQTFTLLGLPVKQILPPVTAPAAPAPDITPPDVTPPDTTSLDATPEITPPDISPAGTTPLDIPPSESAPTDSTSRPTPETVQAEMDLATTELNVEESDSGSANTSPPGRPPSAESS